MQQNSGPQRSSKQLYHSPNSMQNEHFGENQVSGFLAELRFEDLQRLRKIVRKVHFRYYPKEFVTDREADKLIDVMGPATAEKLLRQAIDAKAR